MDRIVAFCLSDPGLRRGARGGQLRLLFWLRMWEAGKLPGRRANSTRCAGGDPEGTGPV